MITNYRKGFTLAEVLITVVIIGVVAALTIPAVVHKYQKHIFKVQFKKEQNTIINAFLLAENDMQHKPNCYYWDREGTEINPTDDCPLMKDIIEKRLKIVHKRLRDSKRTSSDGVIPEYKGLDEVYKENFPDKSQEYIDALVSGHGYWSTSAFIIRREAWVLADNAIILFYDDRSSPFKLFAIDVNGKKGPNKWGYDLIPVKIFSNIGKPLKLVPSESGMIEAGGVGAEEYMY